MTVVDKRNKRPKVEFGTLQVGDFFVDKSDDICMKLSSDKCLYWDKVDGWETTLVGNYEEVTLVKVTLTIEDI